MKRSELKQYVIVAVAVGIAFAVGRYNADQIDTERSARLEQDCESRVEGRDVLRAVVIGAYTPQPGTPPDKAALYLDARDRLLVKAPRLHCVTKDGIPIPVPIKG